jgi:carboxymethylenebutenolidase
MIGKSAAAFLLFAAVNHGPATAATEIAGKAMTLPAKEHPVHVTYFRAAGTERRPAALILHGAGGFERFRAGYETYASDIAAAGIDAYLVEYYSAADASAVESVFEQRYEAWAHLVDDVADDVLKQQDSNGKIALIGFSNGGILAPGAAALDAKITAAVVYYGTVPWPLKQAPARLPPLLILHGDADTIIPLNEGRALAQFAKGLGGSAELVIYPGGKHGFGIRGNEADGADALKRTVAFLHRELAGG